MPLSYVAPKNNQTLIINVKMESIKRPALEIKLPNMSRPPTSESAWSTGLDRNLHEIRVALLQPGNFHDQICCKLTNYSLKKQCPPYEALSYVWRAEPGFQTILLDGRPFQATQNLFLALRRLRKTDEVLRIWVDALCIDQSDIAEKSHQVALMGDIYRRCSRVYCWLGDYQSLSGSPWETMTVEKASSSVILSRGLNLSADDLNLSADEILDDGLAALRFVMELSRGAHLFELVSHSVYRMFFAAIAMFDSPWWDRMWVVQEAILPPEALMVYGSISIPWTVLIQASRAIHAHRNGCCFSDFTVNFTEMYRSLLLKVRSVIEELESTRLDLLRGKTSPFRNLLWRYRGRKASESRDMVYALLGLAKSICPGLELDPDYTLSKQQVYEKITFFSLQSEEKLYILQTDRAFNPTMASWICDWSEELTQSRRISWQENRDWIIQSRRFYKASQDSTYSVSETRASLLPVDGIFVDEVVIVGESCIQGNTTRSWQSVLESWQIMAAKWYFKRKMSTYSSTGTSWEDAFWRTLLCDITSNVLNRTRERTSQEDKRPFDLWWKTFIESTETMPYRRPSLTSYHHGCITASIFASVFERSFFITQEGLMGLGNPQVGSEIWVLSGGDVPFILSPTAEPLKYSLIGGCYVHGIMDGQTFQSPGAEKQCKRIELV